MDSSSYAGSGPFAYDKLSRLLITTHFYHARSFNGFTPRITSVQYCGGCSVLRRLFSTAGGLHQYMWEIASVLWRDGISTVGDCIST